MGTLWGPKFAGFYIVIFFASNVSLAMYAISFAQYLRACRRCPLSPWRWPA